jgi:hypothetical protein
MGPPALGDRADPGLPFSQKLPCRLVEQPRVAARHALHHRVGKTGWLGENRRVPDGPVAAFREQRACDLQRWSCARLGWNLGLGGQPEAIADGARRRPRRDRHPVCIPIGLVARKDFKRSVAGTIVRPPQSVQRVWVCDMMGPICSAKNCWLLSVHIPVATSGAGDADDGDASPTDGPFAHRELSTAQHLGEDRPAEKLSRTPRGSTAQSARCLHAARSQATSPVPRARAGCRGC